MIERIWRALRGGSWGYYQDMLRASDRLDGGEPRGRGRVVGFRLVVRVKGEGMVDVPKS